MKHTIGEWLVNSSSVKANIFSEREIVICETNLLPIHLKEKRASIEEQHANLKLISAAPDLLAALQILLAGLKKNVDMYSAQEKIQIAESAIKKATK